MFIYFYFTAESAIYPSNDKLFHKYMFASLTRHVCLVFIRGFHTLQIMEVTIKRESSEDVLKITRLGTCQKCGAQEARYRCPRCEFRSCCLQCVNLHKKEFDCNGIRDKTRFKSLSQFTELDLLSGKFYLFLSSFSLMSYSVYRLPIVGRSWQIC